MRPSRRVTLSVSTLVAVGAVDLPNLVECLHPTQAGQAYGYLPVFTTAAG